VANKTYESKTIEELKKMRITSAFLIGAIVGVFAFSIFKSFQKGTFSWVAPMILLPLFLLVFKNIKDIEAEIKSRE
jgi:uncharacterized membrane protein YoaK (UPF0700 family)